MQTPTPDELRFARLIIFIARSYAASVTSWIRTPSRNRAVGGVPRSRHIEALAADLVCDHPDDVPPMCELARELGLQPIVENDHVHIQLPRVALPTSATAGPPPSTPRAA